MSVNNICPTCGANLEMVGKAHRCVPQAHPPSCKPKQDVVEGGAERSATGPENRATVMNRDGSTPSPSANLKDAYNAYMREYMRQWRAKRRGKRDSS